MALEQKNRERFGRCRMIATPETMTETGDSSREWSSDCSGAMDGSRRRELRVLVFLDCSSRATVQVLVIRYYYLLIPEVRLPSRRGYLVTLDPANRI